MEREGRMLPPRFYGELPNVLVAQLSPSNSQNSEEIVYKE